MLQGQLLVPSINADATVTANMKSDGELAMELKSEIKFMNAKTEQKIAMTYGMYSFLNLFVEYYTISPEENSPYYDA